MFFKKEMLALGGQNETVELRELTALQRVEYLEYAADHQITGGESVDPLKYIAAINRMDIKLNALLVAMSMIAVTEMDDQRAVLAQQQQVMTSWPSDALREAGHAVMRLSGMLPPASENTDLVDGHHPEEYDAGKS